jgi:hypothetical protein
MRAFFRVHRRPSGLARAVVSAALITAALITAPVAAQDRPSEFASWRVPGWSFTPGFTFGTVYDNNVALSTATAEAGRTDADSLFTMEPFGQLEFLNARTDFSAGYHGSLRRYTTVEELDSFDQRGSVSLKRLASRRVTIAIRNEYANVATTDEVQLNGVPFVRAGSRANNFSGGVDTRLSRLTTLAVRYENNWVDFDREDVLLNGGVVNGGFAELTQRLNERVTLGGEYAIRFADVRQGTREITFQDVGGVVRYALGPQTTVSASAGMSFLDGNLTIDSRRGPYIRSLIEHEGRRATLGAGFDKKFVPSFGIGGSSRSQEVHGYVQMPITKNRTYYQGTFTWSRSEPLELNELRLDSLWHRSTVGYSWTRWLRLEGYYNYTRQDSVITGGELDRHRAGVQIVISQPVRIQ